MTAKQRPEALAQFAESARLGERAGVKGLTATEATAPIPTDSKAKDDAAAKMLAEGATGEDQGSEEAIDRLPDRILDSQGKDNSPTEMPDHVEISGDVSYDATLDPRTGRPPNPLEAQRIARENELERLRLAHTPEEVEDVYEAGGEETLPLDDAPSDHNSLDEGDDQDNATGEEPPPRMVSPSLTEDERQAVENLVRDGIPRERAEELVETHGSYAEILKAAAGPDMNLSDERTGDSDAKGE